MRAKVLTQFVLLALAWGASFLFIKVGLDGLTPAQVVLGRLVAGAAALAVIAVATRQPLPRSPVVWAHLAVVAVLLCVVPFLLFAWAEQHVDSALASIYNATTPLMTTMVAVVALPGERLTRAGLAGLAVGFAGVVVVLAPWQGPTGGAIGAQAACLLATLCYGLSFVYLRRFVSPLRLSAVAVTTVQVGIGAALMLLAAPFVATTLVHLTWPVVLSVTALGVFGTGLAYVWNTNVVADWGATRASTVTYLAPIVGVALGVAVLGEQLSWNRPVGAVIVLLGMALLSRRERRPEPAWRGVPSPRVR
ncbi:DMT family transporter [Lentzea alba]|uniref:DMT family transporter n=1 Tax=Lentzea alba TaxID=2714351 RepID=UPI0039BF774C